MRPMTLPAALAAAWLGLATPALAQGTSPGMRPGTGGSGTPTSVSTTADLAAICLPTAQDPQRLEAIAYCQGYMTAAGQYHSMLHRPGGRRRPLYCLPNPAPTVAESAIAFAQWARQNPQYNQEPALDGLFRWAQATYPCPQEAAPSRPRTSR
ncbi:Rap1a/Tai family immunity protein [Siccirubricoccus phaeus]|uniref:Rap1a/Tai family immunity protein n=1 Tax=Siccirubricoccus phaeus TaxID=2595053 RepID=UPI0011F0B2A8|nr:Rap1a/Tai family immunity protein [Siccirubricoccus phaeus]